jgi:hypothetical protein
VLPSVAVASPVSRYHGPPPCLPIVVAATSRCAIRTKHMADIFQAGDTVPASGVYKVVHHNSHIPTHYVTAIYGDTFPR